MRIRRWGLDYCGVLAGFQSSVKDFQVGRYFISDRRTKGQGTTSYLTEGQKDMIPTPNPHSSTSEATSSITQAKLARSNFVRLHEQEPVAFPKG